MVFTNHVPHHTGGLLELTSWAHTEAVHGIQNTTMHRFQTIPHIRQRPVGNDGHRVIDVTALHKGLNGQRNDGIRIHRQGGLS